MVRRRDIDNTYRLLLFLLAALFQKPLRGAPLAARAVPPALLRAGPERLTLEADPPAPTPAPGVLFSALGPSLRSSLLC